MSEPYGDNREYCIECLEQTKHFNCGDGLQQCSECGHIRNINGEKL